MIIPDKLSIKNRIIEGDVEIANDLNKYFVDSVKESVGIMKPIGKNSDERKYTDEKFNSFQLISADNFNKIIKDLPNKKGTSEGTSTEIIKLVNESIGDIMRTVMNNSIKEGYVPTD